MGKGVGTCVTRNSLSIGNIIGNLDNTLDKAEIEEILADNKLEISEIDKILNTDNREELIDYLEKPKNFIQYTIAKYKLENKDNDIELINQDLNEIMKDLKKNKLQFRALFTDDTLFKDHLLYLSFLGKTESSFNTVKKEFYRFKVNVSLNAKQYHELMPNTLDNFKKDYPQIHHQISISGALNKLIQTKITLKEDIDVDNYNVEMLKENFDKLLKKGGYAGYVNLDLLKYVDEKELENLVNHLKKNDLVDKKVEIRNYKQKTESETSDEKYQLLADIDVNKEDELKEILTSLDYKITDNELDVPSYASWAQINPGKRFSVKLDEDNILHYVPHKSVGTDVKYINTTSIKFPKITGHFTNSVVNDLEKHYYENKAFNLDDLYMVSYDYKNDKSNNFEKIEIGPLRNQEKQENLKKAAQTGEAILRNKGTKYERDMYVRKATKEDLEKYSDYMKSLDDKYIYHKTLKELEATKEKIKSDLKAFSEIEYNEYNSNFKTKEELLNSAQFNNDLQSKYNNFNINNLDKTIQDKITNKIKEGLSFENKETKVFNEIPHDAPMSERGVLKIETSNPQKALEKLKELRLASDLIDKVPYKEIYHAKNYKGRINPISNEYIINPELKPNIPKDYMILHGMTGVNNANEAFARIKRITKLGGLKSIAERRKLNIKNKSLSPKGDIASGIDASVPTKIGNNPSFGDYIVFGMKPEVLKRRDVFFTNQDFGGGHNRYDSYNNYASTIGQGKMHHIANNQARNNHLKNGLGSTNEACFKNEINMNEIDTIFVKGGLFDKVNELINNYKDKGEINKDVKVVNYDINLSSEITKAANKANK